MPAWQSIHIERYRGSPIHGLLDTQRRRRGACLLFNKATAIGLQCNTVASFDPPVAPKLSGRIFALGPSRLCAFKLQPERNPDMPIPTNYIASALAEFRSNRDIVRDILETLSEPELHENHGAANSIAILVQHLHAAHYRRWTDLFTAKPAAVPGNPQEWREDRLLSKAELSALNEEGWGLVIRTLEGFSEADVDRPAPVRGAEGPLLHSILYHWSHYSYHLGQIILLAKIATRGKWTVAAAKQKSEVKSEAGKAAVAV
jgi:uncharacterized damage-inducible protein DinB